MALTEQQKQSTVRISNSERYILPRPETLDFNHLTAQTETQYPLTNNLMARKLDTNTHYLRHKNE